MISTNMMYIHVVITFIMFSKFDTCTLLFEEFFYQNNIFFLLYEKCISLVNTFLLDINNKMLIFISM